VAQETDVTRPTIGRPVNRSSYFSQRDIIILIILSISKANLEGWTEGVSPTCRFLSGNGPDKGQAVRTCYAFVRGL